MTVDLNFVFLLSKQTYNFVSTPKRTYLSKFIDEIIIPNEMVSLDIVKREKMHKINKNRSQSDFFIIAILTNNFIIQKKIYKMINYVYGT